MNLHIQILSKHNSSIQFEEVLNSIGAEPLITVGNLNIYTVVELGKLGKDLSELLYICKLNCYSFKASFDATTCYITIND